MRYFVEIEGKRIRRMWAANYETASRIAWNLIDGGMDESKISILDTEPQSGPRGIHDVTPTFLVAEKAK